jgi:hypothetical protein
LMTETATRTRTQLAVVEAPQAGAVAPYQPPASGMFDPAMFDQMWRVAKVIVASSLVPETLRTSGTSGTKANLPLEEVQANVFLVVNQAFRWGMDPFAVIGSASVVHGRLMWEGKLVAAVIKALAGVRLSYSFNDKTGDGFGVTVSGTLPGETEPRTISGTVGDWKTTGTNSPWGRPGNHPRQLCYRGAREFGRIHTPEVMLGIYTDDEFEVVPQLAVARPALEVNPDATRKAPPPQSPPAAKPKTTAKAAPPPPQSPPAAPTASAATDEAPQAEPPPPLDLQQLEASLECCAPKEYLGIINAAVNPDGRMREPEGVVAALRCAAASLPNVTPAPDVGILAALLAIATAKTTDALLDLEQAMKDATWFKGAPEATRKTIRAIVSAFDTHGGLN